MSMWLHHTQMKSVGASGPKVIVRGEGPFIEDSNGKRYFDMIGGLGCVILGYGREDIIDAIVKQHHEISYVPPYGIASKPSLKLAGRLVRAAPSGITHAIYGVTGGEANEIAIKLSRQYFGKKKFKVISPWDSWRGSTLGALGASGITMRREKFEPLPNGNIHFHPPYCYRCAYEKQYPDCLLFCARFIEQLVKNEGPDTICAYIADPIHSWGIITPPAIKEYFSVIQEICDKYQILMVLDEIVTGMGRTGTMFVSELLRSSPDMIIIGKGVTSGYAPLSAVLVKENVFDAFLGRPEEDREFKHVHTYAGHPPACAAGLAVLDALETEKLVPKVQKLGSYLSHRLTDLQKDNKYVGEVRGLGLLTGVEIVREKQTKERFEFTELAPLLNTNMQKEGVWTFVNPVGGGSISMMPPYVSTQEQLETAVNGIDSAITKTCRNLS